MPEPGARRATIAGRGVAALTCARILARAGWDVELAAAPVRPVPVLLLATPTVELLESIWGPLEVRGHVLGGRVVRWGASPRVEVPDGGLVVEGAALLADLERRCQVATVVDPMRAASDRWLVSAQGRTANGARRLGQRVVLNARATIRPDVDGGLSCMETVDDGWLFLIPVGRDEAVLQAMLPAPPADPARVLRAMLSSSRGVDARVVALAAGEPAVISAAPRAGEPLTSPGRIAVGDAARAFDPLAGDGTGQGVRGALLAAATLESIACGMSERDALGHYAHRVRLTFLRHLAHCLRVYDGAFGTCSAWQAELAPTRDELGDPANRALAGRPFAHRLAGGRLEPLHA